MKVLTVRQPWAFAILHLGKDVENRNWSTTYRGPLAIHAAKSFHSGEGWDQVLVEWEEAGFKIGTESDVRSALIGTVELYDCLPCEQVESPWKDGGDGFFCWMLRNPVPLAVPIPAKGQLGFWNAPDEWFGRAES